MALTKKVNFNKTDYSLVHEYLRHGISKNTAAKLLGNETSLSQNKAFEENKVLDGLNFVVSNNHNQRIYFDRKLKITKNNNDFYDKVGDEMVALRVSGAQNVYVKEFADDSEFVVVSGYRQIKSKFFYFELNFVRLSDALILSELPKNTIIINDDLFANLNKYHLSSYPLVDNNVYEFNHNLLYGQSFYANPIFVYWLEKLDTTKEVADASDIDYFDVNNVIVESNGEQINLRFNRQVRQSEVLNAFLDNVKQSLPNQLIIDYLNDYFIYSQIRSLIDMQVAIQTKNKSKSLIELLYRKALDFVDKNKEMFEDKAMNALVEDDISQAISETPKQKSEESEEEPSQAESQESEKVEPMQAESQEPKEVESVKPIEPQESEEVKPVSQVANAQENFYQDDFGGLLDDFNDMPTEHEVKKSEVKSEVPLQSQEPGLNEKADDRLDAFFGSAKKVAKETSKKLIDDDKKSESTDSENDANDIFGDSFN